MKGTFFQKPLELELNIEGESWKQGDSVYGNLVVKNHGPDSFSLKDYGVSYFLLRISSVVPSKISSASEDTGILKISSLPI